MKKIISLKEYLIKKLGEEKVNAFYREDDVKLQNEVVMNERVEEKV